MPSKVSPSSSSRTKAVFWHRDLPPLEADSVSEHTIESVSGRVPGTLRHRDDLWSQCYDDLMAHTRERIVQELERLGGDYAHVLEESIDSRRDDALGEAWLHGRFTYVLYRARTRP